MQIKIVNKTININDNKITCLYGPLGSGKTDLSMYIHKSILKENKKCGLITNYCFDEMLYNTVFEFIQGMLLRYKYKLSDDNPRIYEVFKMVGLSEGILNEQVFTTSKSEKTKILLSIILIYNPDYIVLDDIFEELDYKSRTKLFKLLIKLKKFYNKTIIVSTSNINLLYELIDDLLIVDNNKIIVMGNKYEVFDNKDVYNNMVIEKPIVIDIKNKIKTYKGIDIGNVDSINELLKALYREMR